LKVSRSAFNKIKATVIENKDEFQAFFDVVKAAAPIIGKVIGAAFSVIGRYCRKHSFKSYFKCFGCFENY
jgi:hypothetical protein